MISKEKSFLKIKIQEDLSSLDTNISQLTELCKPISPECALGDLARFELINDQEISSQALKLALIKRNKLTYALNKIDTQDFGLCLECDEEIGFKRLLLLPESTHCIHCLNQH